MGDAKNPYDLLRQIRTGSPMGAPGASQATGDGLRTKLLSKCSLDAAVVVAVALSSEHQFSKEPASSIRLLAGLGVEGDCHAGRTIKHRSRMAIDPTQPNLRQVHLIPQELIDELQAQGFQVSPGAMGENVTTRGLGLIALPRGTRLRLGAEAEIEITGLRNPCRQLDDYQPGLMKTVLGRSPDGRIVRKAGVMSVVVAGGLVRSGDAIHVTLPSEPYLPLERV
jgi:hypothetical protein